MPADKFQSRLKVLFDDLDRIAIDPSQETAALRKEIETLRARVTELESQFDDLQLRTEAKVAEYAAGASTRAETPMLYEKEEVGFAFTGQTLQPVAGSIFDNFKDQDTLKAPLIGAGGEIGAVIVEPPSERAWSESEYDLAEKVAQQVSLQIQNLRLLSAAERARSEAQSATRRFAHESWQNFLDAIHQREEIGYVYDQRAVNPIIDASLGEADIEETVNVLDQHIGRIMLDADPERPLTEQDRIMVSSVARQIGQQVESLRLLSDAARARAAAEEATRMLTHQGWQDYAEKHAEESFGFLYDSKQVSPLDQTPSDITLSQPLIVKGEAIGQLAVAGRQEFSSEAVHLLSAVAAQASLHLETIRLTDELQRRAAELQELDRLKSSFLANMSHELRTPLNSILGFSDVMLEGIDGPLTDFMSNDLRLIQKNGQHLLHLINDVLDMAKIESGRMNLHPEKFKVHEVFDEVTSITSTLASEKNLALFIEADSDKEIEIFADVTRIRQVMINLVNNSIKFTEKGRVTMRVDRLDEGNVKITVRDTGIGVPETHLETIFQEFSQVDTSTTRKVGGTGLGLPISRKLVEMHGGRMWAESTGINGEGTQMYVILPIESKIAEAVEKTSKK
jgi:signal transduction histidine kinase